MSIRISDRAASVAPFLAMDVLARARQLERLGRDIVHFEIGEPDFPTAPVIKEAAVRALGSDDTHYTPARGQHALIEAIAADYQRRYGVAVDGAQIVVSAGTSPLLLMAFLAVVNPGDEVLIPRPFYPCYPNFVRLAGGVPVFVDTRTEDGFRVQPEALRAAVTPRTRAVLVASPANPTGAVLDAAAQRAVADLGLFVVADEIYHGLVYEGEEHSMLEFSSEAFVINGFSKSFAMTGWRMGYAVVPKALVRTVEVLQQNIVISANSFAQAGAVAALTEPGVARATAEMKAAFDERRRVMLAGVRALGLDVPVAPTGAFYVLADARRFGDSMQLAARMLEEAGVAVTPGDDFGAPGFLRFSYTAETARIREGLARLAKVVA